MKDLKGYLVVILFVLGFVLLLLSPFVATANGQETCPEGGGWVKIDSDDLSLYPVNGATEYCFKAGSDNSQGCTGGLFNSWPQPEGTCGLSHWSYFVPEEEPTDEPTATPTSEELPTPTPTEVGPEPTETPEDEPELTPTPDDPPVEPTPDFPSAGFTSQTELINGEPWQLPVPGNVWAAHNQEGWPAAEWWMLWVGQEFLFNGQWYTTVEYIIADPTEVELLGRAVDFDLMLITCRSYSAETNSWAERLVIFANLSGG